MNTTNQAHTEHHPHGMSKWPAILECPVFEGRGESRDAAMGTAVHKAFAGYIEDWKLGLKLPGAEELSLHEAGALRAAKAVCDEVGRAVNTSGGVFTETRVSLDGDVFGTCDAFFVDEAEKVVHVYDFKTFFNPGRDYFAQLIGYGLAILQERHGMDALFARDFGIECTVLYGDSAEVSRRRVDFMEAVGVWSAAESAFSAREEGRAKPCQCNWCELCAHFGTCPACMRQVVSLPAVEGVEALPAAAGPEAEAAGASMPWKWDVLEPAVKARMLVLAEFAGKWADAVRALAKADALSGAVLADEANGIAFRLRESRGRARPRVNELWPLMVAHKVSAEAFRERLSISASDAERLLRDAGMRAREAKEAVLAVSDVGAGCVSLVRC